MLKNKYVVIVLRLALVAFIVGLVAWTYMSPAAAMPPSPDDFCDGHGGVADFDLEIIGWFHGAPITTGYIFCGDGMSVDW